MKKARALILLAVLFWLFNQTAFVYSQEEQEEEAYPEYDEEAPIDDLWEGYYADPYGRGDQTFTITLGVIFPTLFYDNNGERITNHNFNPPVGGTGSLSYNYFFHKYYFLGIEIGVKFNYTLGENTLFIIPIGVRTGVQFVYRRIEFPIVIVAGVSPHRYLNYSYVGFFLKGGASVFFRFNPDWSFGLNAEWSWYPQRPRDPARNTDGNFFGVTLTARYHF